MSNQTNTKSNDIKQVKSVGRPPLSDEEKQRNI
jgi:hypothetical protein